MVPVEFFFFCFILRFPCLGLYLFIHFFGLPSNGLDVFADIFPGTDWVTGARTRPVGVPATFWNRNVDSAPASLTHQSGRSMAAAAIDRVWRWRGAHRN